MEKRPRGRPRRVPEVKIDVSKPIPMPSNYMSVEDAMAKIAPHTIQAAPESRVVAQEVNVPSQTITLPPASDKPMRAPMREESPLEAAQRRAEEIMGHIGEIDTGSDEFYFDPTQVPEGWSYEWKRMTVYNQKDPAYEVQLRKMGWQPVPAKRHPEMTEPGAATIDRKGLQLMERPLSITERVIAIDKKRARDQVRAKEEQLTGAPVGTFERTNKDASMVKINKTVERMEIPN